MRLLPNSLFGRTAAFLLAIFIGAQGVALYMVYKSVIAPLAERSADDLAARMVLAAQTWVELPPDTRPDYEIELFLQHNLELGKVDSPLEKDAEHTYFGVLLEKALRQRTGQRISLKEGPDPAWAWAEIHIAGNLLRLGFIRDRYELQAPIEAAAVFLAGAMLTLLAALAMAQRTSVRLRQLANSAHEVGQGRLPERLPETGAEELKSLTATFNRMADEVQGLLENRTVLLSGISHDLRTPLTRLQLALAMLDDADADLVRRMEGDLAEMSRLISEMLNFARSLQGEREVEADLNHLLSEMAASCSHPDQVRFTPAEPCLVTLSEMAFNRTVGNLVENALRYSEGKIVDLELACSQDYAWVRVMDRGPSIPAAAREAVFRPFYRLESSRSRHTGGSGLGLAIVRQLADAQGWEVALGDREGGGLRVQVTIPRQRQKHRPSKAG